ncbi:glycosyltransferase [Natrialbaceae archaeon A-CW3]
MEENKFSVLLPTYKGDKPESLQRSIISLLNQTLTPNEIVIVADGSLTPELKTVLNRLESTYPELIMRTSLPNNQGLGAALNHGVKVCSHELIARLDSDDVALENRFEQQISYLAENPNIDVLGGHVAEFSNSPDEIDTIRKVPISPEEVRSHARFRCPINHPSVMFRRSAVLDAGNYGSFRSMQDYELWMRMLSQGYSIANLPDILVKCEAGKGLFHRRGGINYAKLEIALQYQFWKMGAISLPIFIFNIGMRLPIRLAPNRFREIIYRKLFRF